MRLLIQRVSEASVVVNGAVVGEIGRGLLVLVGLGQGDTPKLFAPALEKMRHLRIFGDEAGNLNRSAEEVGAGLLLVSQFTLYADARKGRRPSFTDALPPAEAAAQYAQFVEHVRSQYTAGPVASGVFGAMMEVRLVNEGPVTIWLDSREMNWGA